MIIPLLAAAASGGVSHVATKASKDAETKEKLDLVKDLAELTPEQAKAVDALKEQSVEEMRTRKDLGIGPFKPLPEQASEKAREARARVQAKLEARGTQGGKERALAEKVKAMPPDQKEKVIATIAQITPEERTAVLSSRNPEAVIKQIAANKMAEAAKSLA
jgi:Lon protease-like protein